MNIYRKIYQTFYGPIPKDENGRSYDIHHIDGNRKNNNIFNLVALSIQDHFNIHYYQGDWAACARISQRMSLAPMWPKFPPQSCISIRANFFKKIL